jgi:hypothetical protein
LVSGETETSVSAWTTDTLHELFIRVLGEQDMRHVDRFRSIESTFTDHLRQVQQEVSAALVAHDKVTREVHSRYDQRFDALGADVIQRFDGLHREAAAALLARDHILSERNARYDDRFKAQEHAVEITAEAVRSETRLALAAVERARDIQDRAAERALAIASTELDKQLAKLNEYRGALSDLGLTMMPRAEAKLLSDSLAARIDVNSSALADINQTLIAMRSGMQGQDTGEHDARRSNDRSRQQMATLITIVLATLTIIVAMYAALHSGTVVVPPTK